MTLREIIRRELVAGPPRTTVKRIEAAVLLYIAKRLAIARLEIDNAKDYRWALAALERVSRAS